MRSRRVLISFEIETDVSRSALEKATIRVGVPGNIKYLENAKVNVVRADAKARGKKEKK